jgi:hypothetical protein
MAQIKRTTLTRLGDSIRSLPRHLSPSLPPTLRNVSGRS